MKRVVVIGGGAAGLMAAVIAGREGAKVTLLEKMNYVGKKDGHYRQRTLQYYECL